MVKIMQKSQTNTVNLLNLNKSSKNFSVTIKFEMRKTLILIIVVIVLVIIAIVLAKRQPRTCCGNETPKLTSSSFKGVQNSNVNRPVTKVNMILSTESKLLSYSIVFKNLKHEVDSVYFVVDDTEVFQASGPRDPEAEGGDIVVHGLWREKSRVPITAKYISDLTNGRMSALVKFKDTNIEPFSVEMRPT
jgi:hypothetical protein